MVADWRPLRRGSGKVLIDLHPSRLVPRADLLDLRLTLTLARHRDGRCCTVCYDAPFRTGPPRFDIAGPQGCLSLARAEVFMAPSARWRGGADSSPPDRASVVAVHPTRWLISTQVPPRLPPRGRLRRLGGRAARALRLALLLAPRARRRRHERRARDAPDAALGPPRQLVRHRGPRLILYLPPASASTTRTLAPSCRILARGPRRATSI